MRILQCINSLSSGGAEVLAADLAIAQKKSGCEVRVFSYCGAIDKKGMAIEESLSSNGITHTSPLIRKNHLKPLVPIHIARAIDDFKPDICHSHMEQTDFFVWLGALLSKHRPPLARTIHNVYAPKVLPAFIHRQLAKAYLVNIACSKAVLDQYLYLGKNRRAINNGISLESFSPKLQSHQIRTQLGIDEKTPLLIHIGAFAIRNKQLQKAQDIIVQALASLQNQDYVVAFLGDGDQRSSIEALATTLGVSSNCRFLGRVTNPVDYLFAADGVLMPSRFEGLSIGCIEAACAGKPVIASNIAAFGPFFRPSTIFVAPESIQELALAIQQLLDRKDHFNELAAQYQANYRVEFDMHTVSKKYVDLYGELLQEARSGEKMQAAITGENLE